MPYRDDRARTSRSPEPGSDLGVDLCWQAPDGSVWVVQCKRYENPARPVDDAIAIECPICAADRDGEGAAASALTAAASGAYLGLGDDTIAVLPPHTLLVEGPSDVAALAALLLTPPVGAETDSAEFGPMVRRVKAMLRHWEQVAQRPHLPSMAFELLCQRLVDAPAVGGRLVDERRAGWQAAAAARCAVQAAYAARDAVVHEHPSTSREVVAQFVARWLGLRPTKAIVEAAANALLQAPLDGTDPDGDHAVVRRLRTATRMQRRAWRPLGETRIRHAPIDSLDRRLRIVGEDEPLTVADTVGTCYQPGDGDGWADPRIPRVLARLRPAEQRVALVYVRADTVITWAQAAARCGEPPEFGERVRRKLLREGRLLSARLAASRARPQAA